MSVFRRSLLMLKLAVQKLVLFFQGGKMTLNDKGRGNKTLQIGNTVRLTDNSSPMLTSLVGTRWRFNDAIDFSTMPNKNILFAVKYISSSDDGESAIGRSSLIATFLDQYLGWRLCAQANGNGAIYIERYGWTSTYNKRIITFTGGTSATDERLIDLIKSCATLQEINVEV